MGCGRLGQFFKLPCPLPLCRYYVVAQGVHSMQPNPHVGRKKGGEQPLWGCLQQGGAERTPIFSWAAL